jgi:membrane protease YdiL (CAAX protease family)
LGIWPEFSAPFSRVFDRVVLAAALLFFFTFRRRLSVKPGLPSETGSYGIARSVLFGFTLTATTALAVLPLVVDPANGIEWSVAPLSAWGMRLLSTLLTAAVVGALEEFVFRGVLFGSLRSARGFWFAAVTSSLVYATVHFLTPAKDFRPVEMTAWLGFEYFGIVCQRLLHPGTSSGIIGLFLVGMTLCEAVRRTGRLWLAIGLHAGWILAAKVSTHATILAPDASVPLGLGKRYFIVGMPIVWLTILVCWLMVSRFGSSRSGGERA